MAHQAGYAKLAEPAHHLVEMLGIDIEPDLRVLNLETVDAREAVEAGGRPLQHDGDGSARQVAHLLQGSALLRAAQPNDAEAVAEGLDLGQDVAGEQHCPALGLDLPDAVLEDGLHQGVEAGRGLVEEQELGVGGERRHQADLLAVPLGVGARLLGRIELEAQEKLVPPPPVEVAAEPAEEIDDLSPAEVRPQAHLAGYVRETAVQRHRVAPWVTAEKRDAPCVGAKEAKQDSDGRGLARAVGSEEAVDLACFNLQIEPVQSAGRSEALDEPGHDDRWRHA